MKNHKIQSENLENHANPIISQENNENYENHENH